MSVSKPRPVPADAFLRTPEAFIGPPVESLTCSRISPLGLWANTKEIKKIGAQNAAPSADHFPGRRFTLVYSRARRFVQRKFPMITENVGTDSEEAARSIYRAASRTSRLVWKSTERVLLRPACGTHPFKRWPWGLGRSRRPHLHGACGDRPGRAETGVPSAVFRLLLIGAGRDYVMPNAARLAIASFRLISGRMTSSSSDRFRKSTV